MFKLNELKVLLKLYPNKSLLLLDLVALVMFILTLVLFRLRKRKIRKKFYTITGSFFLSLSLLTMIALITIFNWQNNNRKARKNVIENTEIHGLGDYTFGIDLSHYQGTIDWSLVKESKHAIEFVYIRCTMGADGVDKTYANNIMKAKNHGFLIGSYHFYRPNENSTKQFENFKKNIKIQEGHLYPVLDIESESKFGIENLRQGIRNFLVLAEQEFGVKPIIYTGLHFYKRNLKGYFDDYPLWIAAYSGKNKLKGVKWDFHQISERVKVKGINGNVDGNDFNGNLEKLKLEFLIR